MEPVKRRKLNDEDVETGFDVPKDEYLESEKQTPQYAEVAPTPLEKSVSSEKKSGMLSSHA